MVEQIGYSNAVISSHTGAGDIFNKLG